MGRISKTASEWDMEMKIIALKAVLQGSALTPELPELLDRVAEMVRDLEGEMGLWTNRPKQNAFMAAMLPELRDAIRHERSEMALRALAKEDTPAPPLPPAGPRQCPQCGVTGSPTMFHSPRSLLCRTCTAAHAAAHRAARIPAKTTP